MFRYQLDHRISHADVDFLGELKVSALLGLLEGAAVEASTACGFDAARYTHEGRIWIIRRTRLHRLVPVGGGETMHIETQVADFRRARSLRRYTVRRGAEAVAEATTDWVYCDLASGRPVRIPEELQQALMGGAAAPMLPRADPLPSESPAAAAELHLSVYPSHLDHVVHVNNGIYANYLEDGAFVLFAAIGWPLARMLGAGGALRVRRLDCEYLSDAQAGDQLCVRSWMSDDAFSAATDAAPPAAALLVQSITRGDGHQVLRARTDWVWRYKPVVVGGVPAG